MAYERRKCIAKPQQAGARSVPCYRRINDGIYRNTADYAANFLKGKSYE
ncbi:MAG: hypothetical protein RSE10_06225 [Oscillospiraceae bacterium]